MNSYPQLKKRYDSCQMTINSFSDWLNTIIAERGLRPADLARLANINKGILSRILSNERRPAPETLESIARALRLPSVLVFQKAGLLPPSPQLDERRIRFETLLAELSDEDVEDLYALALAKLERQAAKKRRFKTG